MSDIHQTIRILAASVDDARGDVAVAHGMYLADPDEPGAYDLYISELGRLHKLQTAYANARSRMEAEHAETLRIRAAEHTAKLKEQYA